jgi:hypothetical protein
MASTGYELLPWATLSSTLPHKVIHGSLHIFHVQRAAFSDQLLDVKFTEPCRACVVRKVQRVYMRARLVSLANKEREKEKPMGIVHPCNAYAARAGVKAVGICPWGPPCMTVIKGCALRRFGSIKIVSTGYRSGIGSTAALSSRRALSTRSKYQRSTVIDPKSPNKSRGTHRD